MNAALPVVLALIQLVMKHVIIVDNYYQEATKTSTNFLTVPQQEDK